MNWPIVPYQPAQSPSIPPSFLRSLLDHRDRNETAETTTARKRNQTVSPVAAEAFADPTGEDIVLVGIEFVMMTMTVTPPILDIP